MGINKLYELRNNFILIGLTGRMGGGAHDIASLLCEKNNPFVEDKILEKEIQIIKDKNVNEGLKFEILQNFIKHEKNWNYFQRIEYKNVILFHLLHGCFDTNIALFKDNIINNILKIGSFDNFQNERFGSSQESTDFIKTELKELIDQSLCDDCLKDFSFTCEYLNDCLEGKEINDDSMQIVNFFFGDNFQNFAKSFYEILDQYKPSVRHRFVHILAMYCRLYGRINVDEIINDKRNSKNQNLDHVYTIAKTIKFLVKAWKSHQDSNNIVNIVIDKLKNSFEINYFRERFSGFYMVSVNRIEEQRKKVIEKKASSSTKESAQSEKKELERLDNVEYLCNDFKEGKFAAADIENCIQKSDYHIFLDNENVQEEETEEIDIEIKKTGRLSTAAAISQVKKSVIDQIEKKDENFKNAFEYKSKKLQLLKLLCLIKQPGIISPSGHERIMQIAFNAKLSSGCISRQVGAVVTDKYFSVKGIGWNEVPEGQTPCSLRNVHDLVGGQNMKVFTDFEKKGSYKDGSTFIGNVRNSINSVDYKKFEDKTEGRNCPFCFKEFHNAFEGEKNQVHTRSLHAEENAMLQITKYGGQSVKGGNLFTTASPCELCSKKAYQLGLVNIFYIDPYPGIAKTQILKGGNNPGNNPHLFMFQGAIGRGFNKFYEPFMSIKDETKIRSGIKPKQSDAIKVKNLKNILEKELKDDKDTISKLDSLLKDNPEALKDFVQVLRKGLEEK